MQDPAAGRHSRLRQRQRHVRRWGHTGHGGVDGLIQAGAGLLAAQAFPTRMPFGFCLFHAQQNGRLIGVARLASVARVALLLRIVLLAQGA
ncbi:hypothetical protein G6F22_013744 [Rhizopus arrhizus]|nr:hypothetical protein G6F22_013744 [Rhizopus arrhizus]